MKKKNLVMVIFLIFVFITSFLISTSLGPSVGILIIPIWMVLGLTMGLWYSQQPR